MERFPAYVPELNPLEYLWAALKGKPMANYSPDTIAELDDRLRRSMRQVRRRDMGLNFIKKAGLISKTEYLQLCKDQRCRFAIPLIPCAMRAVFKYSDGANRPATRRHFGNGRANESGAAFEKASLANVR